MKLFWTAINAFLIAFAVDGVVSLVDQALVLATGIHLLGWLRAPIAFLVILGALLAWCAMVATPRVPKSVFAPLLVLMVWYVCGMMPGPVYLSLDQLGLGAAVLQVTVTVAVLLRTRQLTGGALTFPPTYDEERAFFSWKNAAAVTAVTFLAGPPMLGIYAFVSTDIACKVSSADFIRLNPSGLEVAHKQYKRGDKTIDLIGMSHIGDQKVYDTLFEDISPNDTTLLLEEGVSDRDGHLGEGPVYDKVAKRVGLSTQKPMHQMTKLKIRNADIDVNEFSEETLEVLDIVLSIYRADDPIPPLLNYISFAQNHPDPEGLSEQVMDDLITRRNNNLVQHIEDALLDHNRLIVPWGAYHMKGVEAEVLADGFHEVSDFRHTIVPFKLIYGRE